MAASRETPLHALHTRLGAKLVDFAGWSLPVSYQSGVIAEHRACREGAALFDVSHMRQIALRPPASATVEDAAAALETLVPGGIVDLPMGRTRYTMFTNEAGGVLDDLMAANLGDRLFLVVNAARADHDEAHLRAALDPRGVTVEPIDNALLALQGPAAEATLAHVIPECAALDFMATTEARFEDCEIRISRLGYTGEDGFEISAPPDSAEPLAKALIDRGATPAGLGARDTLRLEAGLCLYGHELDETTTPAEAGLGWTIPRRRREAADFPGAQAILAQLRDGAPRRLVALRPEGRAPARAGAEIRSGEETVGVVTSGGFAPSLDAPAALGYVSAEVQDGAQVALMVRGRALPAIVSKPPLVPHRYRRPA